MVHATNETLRRTIASYAAFFFSGVSDAVTVEFSATVRDGDRRVAELGRACTSGSRRLVVVANYTDCSTKMLTVLSGLPSTRVVPVMLVSPAAALFADESPPAVELPHTVQKPVTLRQLCSAIERAIANEPASPLSRSLSLSVSASSRKLSDGTLTQGARLATSGQMEAATIEQAAARPGHSTVLIADDFELIRSLVQQLVAQQGYNTLVAANGEEAVALVRQHYDVLAMVLMDCEMPEVDGYAATQQIRRYERERGIPPSKQVYVCAMTANAMNDDSKRCFANHMSGFLAKPVSRADLQSKLTEHGRTPTERGIEAIGATRKPKKAKKKRAR
uniref:Response regulatory domain-containing protein n=1 Tax=Sexangularia sp. CB-2014 TaxID=1486929 RepID=A0A7S1V2X7_9EUKA